MKLTSKSSIYLQIAALLLALSFGLKAYAAPPREEIVHAYRLVKGADHDYDGHRVAALKELQIAGEKLGLTLEGEGVKEEAQWKSDRRMREARRILKEARDKLEARDRDRAAEHVDIALKELDRALNIK
jgi:hypothetical protein